MLLMFDSYVYSYVKVLNFYVEQSNEYNWVVITWILGQRQEQEEREETECYAGAEDPQTLPQHLCGRVWWQTDTSIKGAGTADWPAACLL